MFQILYKEGETEVVDILESSWSYIMTPVNICVSDNNGIILTFSKKERCKLQGGEDDNLYQYVSFKKRNSVFSKPQLLLSADLYVDIDRGQFFLINKDETVNYFQYILKDKYNATGFNWKHYDQTFWEKGIEGNVISEKKIEFKDDAVKSIWGIKEKIIFNKAVLIGNDGKSFVAEGMYFEDIFFPSPDGLFQFYYKSFLVTWNGTDWTNPVKITLDGMIFYADEVCITDKEGNIHYVAMSENTEKPKLKYKVYKSGLGNSTLPTKFGGLSKYFFGSDIGMDSKKNIYLLRAGDPKGGTIHDVSTNVMYYNEMINGKWSKTLTFTNFPVYKNHRVQVDSKDRVYLFFIERSNQLSVMIKENGTFTEPHTIAYDVVKFDITKDEQDNFHLVWAEETGSKNNIKERLLYKKLEYIGQ